MHPALALLLGIMVLAYADLLIDAVWGPNDRVDHAHDRVCFRVLPWEVCNAHLSPAPCCTNKAGVNLSLLLGYVLIATSVLALCGTVTRIVWDVLRH